MRVVGLLGGTFNPIHLGHLRLAEELANALNFDEVRFIPSANPPHKPVPSVTAKHRAEMVALAIQNNAKFKLDTTELQRAGASYTIDTLKSLREELGENTSLCLIMGSDAFVKLDTWHEWETLINYCNIILVQRPQPQKTPLNTILQAFLGDHYTENNDDLVNNPAGFITMQAITALDISSTNIRNDLSAQKSTRYLMPDNVLNYISQHQLYQLQDSSAL